MIYIYIIDDYNVYIDDAHAKTMVVIMNMPACQYS
eukprot:COSAG06_NODE_7512_length_2474_cov_3.243697_1_plen_35_part_00